jgi:hypothetical protein
VVKTLVASLPGDTTPPVDPLLFDRRYVLVRDPRDRLISLLLFLPHWSTAAYPPLWRTRALELSHYVATLRTKVLDPARVPTWLLFERCMRLRFGWRHGEALPTLHYLQQTFLHWHATLPDHETVFYEALTMAPWGQGVDALLPRAYARVLRRGLVGEWRQWFTPEDCAYFRPVFQPYLTWYGYDNDWTLSDTPQIDHATSIRYLETWLRVDRRAARASA